MTLDYSEIGQNIKYYRNRKHLKQAELAELVNVSAQHISHVECGKTKLSLPVLLQIAEVLSVNIYTLLGSNVKMRNEVALDTELASILQNTSPAQKRQCIELCRTAIEFGTGIATK